MHFVVKGVWAERESWDGKNLTRIEDEEWHPRARAIHDSLSPATTVVCVDYHI